MNDNDETGNGQLILPGLGPRLAVQVLRTLCDRWKTEILAGPVKGRPNKEMDFVGLACLVLAKEDWGLFWSGSVDAIRDCMDMARFHETLWEDIITWNLVSDYVLNGKPSEYSIRELLRQLVGDTTFRCGWVHQVAWIIRGDLDAKRVSPILLRNLEMGHFGADRSGGLLYAMHPNHAELLAQVHAHAPEIDGLKNFAKYISMRDLTGWPGTIYPFGETESMCRQIICECVHDLDLTS